MAAQLHIPHRAQSQPAVSCPRVKQYHVLGEDLMHLLTDLGGIQKEFGQSGIRIHLWHFFLHLPRYSQDLMLFLCTECLLLFFSEQDYFLELSL